MKMNFTSMRIKTHFQIHGIALSLTLKRKRLVARKLACVAGGTLVSGALSWRRSRHAKRSGDAARELQIDLYTHPSLRSAVKTIQHSQPSAASCAGYLVTDYSLAIKLILTRKVSRLASF